MTRLDVIGEFDAAWCQAILKRLRDAKCPRIFTNLRNPALEGEEQ